jgi:hypothetical protein
MIRHQQTCLFLKNEQEWTNRPEEARHFESIWAAADFAIQHGLENVESVLQFQADPPVACDVYYSLRGAKPGAQEGTRLGYEPIRWSGNDEEE